MCKWDNTAIKNCLFSGFRLSIWHLEEKVIHEKITDEVEWSMETSSKMCGYKSRMILDSVNILYLYML